MICENEKFIQFIEQNRGEFSFIDAAYVAKDDDIRHIEQAIQCALPASYIWFLKKYGAGGIDGADINGVGVPEFRYHIIEDTTKLIENSNNLKEGKFLLLEEYEEGWVFLLDLTHCRPGDDDAPVVAYNTFSDVVDPVWNSFCAFIQEWFGFAK